MLPSTAVRQAQERHLHSKREKQKTRGDGPKQAYNLASQVSLDFKPQEQSSLVQCSVFLTRQGGGPAPEDPPQRHSVLLKLAPMTSDCLSVLLVLSWRTARCAAKWLYSMVTCLVSVPFSSNWQCLCRYNPPWDPGFSWNGWWGPRITHMLSSPNGCPATPVLSKRLFLILYSTEGWEFSQSSSSGSFLTIPSSIHLFLSYFAVSTGEEPSCPDNSLLRHVPTTSVILSLANSTFPQTLEHSSARFAAALWIVFPPGSDNKVLISVWDLTGIKLSIHVPGLAGTSQLFHWRPWQFHSHF